MKIVLLCFLEATRLSSDLKKIVNHEYMSMVENLAYALTIEQLQNKDMKVKFTHYKQHIEVVGKKTTYTLDGFMFTSW